MWTLFQWLPILILPVFQIQYTKQTQIGASRAPILDEIIRKVVSNSKEINALKKKVRTLLNKKSEKCQNWHDIDWKITYKDIAKAQSQIVVEYIKGNNLEVNKLQRKLINSFSARAFAVRKVVTNSGGKTAGVDNKTLKSPKEYMEAIRTLKEITTKPDEYKAKPLRRVYILKANGKDLRPLGIPTVKDRTVQALYHLAIDPIVEQMSDPNSYGFRKERSTQDAIAQFRNYMNKTRSPRWILEADISKCFDKINHQFLMKHTPICDKGVLKQWLESGAIEGRRFSPTKEGTPQGGIISPMLCNVALNGLEKTIKGAIPGKKSKIKVIRYADDIVVTGNSPEILLKAKQVIEDFIKIRGLQLNQLKTSITDIKAGIDLLGFNIIRLNWTSKNTKTQQKDVLMIRPSKKGFIKVKQKLKEIFKICNKMREVIIKANPIIRGWCEHKRISWHSMESFQKLNKFIWENIKAKFINRKTGRTSKRRNWSRIKSNNKWFSDSQGVELFNPISVTTKKHELKRVDLNPYLQENWEYFEKKKSKRLITRWKTKIYNKYKNKCVVCDQSLLGEEKVEIHHIKSRKSGGKTTLSNLQPLHKICHVKVTHQKLNQN